MVKYVCSWRDRRGKEHASESLALSAERQYDEEEAIAKRNAEIKYNLNREIDYNNLPHFYSYDNHYPYREYGPTNRDQLVNWVIKHQDMLRSVLNG